MKRHWNAFANIVLWELTFGIAVGALAGAIKGTVLLKANGYLGQGLSNTALYVFTLTVGRWTTVSLTVAAAIAAVTLLCFLSARRARTAAIFVSVPVILIVSYFTGYEINRYDFKAAWLATRPLLGIPIRAAFLDTKVVMANIGVLAVSLGAGWVAYRLLTAVLRRVDSRKLARSVRMSPYWISLPMAIAVVGLLSFSAVHRAGQKPAGPNVILISLDTLRRDHLGCYGYERETSPRIDQFADQSVLFENAVTQAGSTLSSHKAIMTSMYPPLLKVPGDQRLNLRREALAEMILDRGYSTAAFANGLGWVTPLFRFNQGFETYVVPSRRIVPKLASAEEITGLALGWLKEHNRHPFLLFLHYGDIHSGFRTKPYDAPKPYGSMFLPAGSERFDRSGEQIKGSDYLSAINWGRYDPSPEEIEYLEALYDGGIRYTDYHLGRLFDGLQSMGILDNTLVVIFADHGEEFREHGRMLHGWVYCEVARVPLLIRFPRGQWAGTRVSQLVQLVDIAPTVLADLGIKPGREMSGVNLADVIGGGPSAGVAYTEGEDAYAIRTDRWMYSLDIEDGHREMYEIGVDPLERVDIKGQFPQDERSVEERLLGWINVVEAGTLRGNAGQPAKLDRKTRELLKSLGYLQTGE